MNIWLTIENLKHFWPRIVIKVTYTIVMSRGHNNTRKDHTGNHSSKFVIHSLYSNLLKKYKATQKSLTGMNNGSKTSLCIKTWSNEKKVTQTYSLIPPSGNKKQFQ